MNLDDLLKSIREEDDDSKGGKDLDDLLASIRSEETSGAINPAKFFDNDKYDNFYKELVEEGTVDDQNLSEEERQKGIAIYRDNKLNFKKFVTDIQRLKPEFEKLSQEPSTRIPESEKLNKEIISFKDQFFVAPKIEPSKLIPTKDEELNEEFEKKLDELIAVVRESNELEEDIQDDEKKLEQRKRREDREKRIETKKFFKNSINELVNKNKTVGGFLDAIKKFLGFTLLSGLVNTLYNWLTDPENEKKIDKVKNFLLDWWPALAGAIAFVLTPFKGLILGAIGLLASTSSKILALFATNPIFGIAVAFGVAGVMDYLKGERRKIKLRKEVAELMEKEGISETEARIRLREQKEKEKEKIGFTANPFDERVQELRKEIDQLQNIDFERTRTEGFFPPKIVNRAPGFSGGGLNMGTDVVPAMLTPGEFIMSRGAVNKFGVDFMESINAMGGGTNKPKFGRVAYAAGGGLLDFIGSGEGTYDSMNQGTDKFDNIVGSALNSETKIGKKLTDMTIGEIKERQKFIMNFNNPQVSDYGIFAAGKYQIVPENMDAALKGTGLTDDDMFSPANQDIMGMNLIMNKAGREILGAYLRGKSDDIINAQIQLAKEFASVPVPIDTMGAYGPVKAGQSFYAGDGNKARHTVAETKEALINQRKSNLVTKNDIKTKESDSNVLPTPSSSQAIKQNFGVKPGQRIPFEHDGKQFNAFKLRDGGFDLYLDRMQIDTTGGKNAAVLDSFIQHGSERQNQIENNFKSIREKLSNPIDTFIMSPLRRVFPVGTPNVPTSSKTIILPPVEAPERPQQQDDNRDIPEFKITSSARMRNLITKTLGIEDLVGAK